jgi:hypothetical protein
VRCLVTRANIEYLDEFYADLKTRIGPNVELALSTPYTNQDLTPMRASAFSIVQHDIDDSLAITAAEAQVILQDKYQGRYELEDGADAVDNYLSLTTYGTYTCCNGAINIGDPQEKMSTLIDRLMRAERKCQTCYMFPCI